MRNDFIGHGFMTRLICNIGANCRANSCALSGVFVLCIYERLLAQALYVYNYDLS